jgi:hypothetical protein
MTAASDCDHLGARFRCGNSSIHVDDEIGRLFVEIREHPAIFLIIHRLNEVIQLSRLVKQCLSHSLSGRRSGGFGLEHVIKNHPLAPDGSTRRSGGN